jgi:hypothetical protein
MAKLFLKPMVKEAAGVTVLSPNTNMWQDEVMQYLMTSLPFLGNLNTEVAIENLNTETGSMFAKVFVSPRVKRPGDQEVAIPIIAANRKLKPIDVMATQDSYQPLTEDRLLKLFPTSDIGFQPPDQPDTASPSLWSQTMSPMQSMYDTAPQVKQSSLLVEALQTSSSAAREAFIKEASSVEYIHAARENEYLKDVLCAVGEVPTEMPAPSLEKGAQIEPYTIQVCKEGNSYLVKAAHPAAYYPIVKHVSATEFSEFDSMIKEAVLNHGYCTIIQEDTVSMPTSRVPEHVELIEKFASCRVWDHNRHAKEGIVLPAMRVTGTPAGMLYLDDDSYAMQEKCAGVTLETFTQEEVLDVFSGERVAGHGSFIMPDGDTLKATEPLTVKYAELNDSGKVYHCASDSGYSCKVIPVDGLIRPIVKEGSIHIPSDSGFVSLGKEVPIEDSLTIIKVAHSLHENLVKVASSGSEWTITGEAVANIPAHERTNVSRAQGSFVLTMTGCDPDTIEDTLSKAASRHTQTLNVPFTVGDYAELEKHASADRVFRQSLFSKVHHPGHSLVKLAVEAVPDQKTLDSILSLGFLTPENIEVFMGHIPDLESALRKICELLVMSRLGFNLDEQHLRTCMTTMDSVITDLNYMASDAYTQMTEMKADPSMSALPQQTQSVQQAAPNGMTAPQAQGAPAQ